MRSVPNAQPSVPKPPAQRTPIVTRSRSRRTATDRTRCSPDLSVHPSENVSVCSPQPQSSLEVFRADSSLDLDEDETSVLMEESLARSDTSYSDDGVSVGGGHEADVSVSELDLEQESKDIRTPPRVLPSVWPQLVCSTECSKPRRLVRHRSKPAWLRTGEWHISWPWVSHLTFD